MDKFGENVRQLRLKRCLTQEALGKKIGVQKSAIAKYETGRVPLPSPATLARLVAALGTTEAYLTDALERDLYALDFTISKQNGVVTVTDEDNGGVTVSYLEELWEQMREVDDFKRVWDDFQKKKAPAPGDGDERVYPAGYDLLTEANRKIVDQMIAALAKQQSPD